MREPFFLLLPAADTAYNLYSDLYLNILQNRTCSSRLIRWYTSRLIRWYTRHIMLLPAAAAACKMTTIWTTDE